MLNTKKLPVKTYTKEDFAWVSWTPKAILALPHKVLTKIKEDHEAIKKIPKDKRTFENTVAALEKSGDPYATQFSYLEVLLYTSPKKEVRDAAKSAQEIYSQAIVDIEYDEELYRAIQEYVKGNAKRDKLEVHQKRMLKDIVLGYKRMGFDLAKRERERVKKLIKKLSLLSISFSKNIDDYKDSIKVSPKEVQGLPIMYLEGLKRDSKGNYIITLEYPDSGPFMQNAKSDKKRKELADKLSQKGGKKNLRILIEIIKVRQEFTSILGYKTYAEYATEVRMAKNSKQVLTMVEDLILKVQATSQKELEEVVHYKRKVTGDKRATYLYYDQYYTNELKKEKYQVDNEKIREYFPLERVRKGLFEVYETILGVTFEKIDLPKWHNDVEHYVVKDSTGVRSYFSFDFFPRDGKFGHACNIPIINGRVEGSKGREVFVAPWALMIMNFPKPQKGVPSLISHDEVETLFHEFGHAMHAVMSKTIYESQSGNNCAWDFVETPSQMSENWAWEREILKKISAHYKTGEPLPDTLIDQMLKARHYLIAFNTLAQLVLTKFDMVLHSKRGIKDITKLYSDMRKKYLKVASSKLSLFPAGFGHMDGAYAAGYYSYLWANVFAQDLYTRFKNEGLLSKKVGADYREWILEKGSSMDEMELVKGFLGRKPNNKAFLRSIGVGK